MNESNLTPFTKENASENGRRGAVASAVSKNEKKKLKEQIQEAVYMPIRDEQVRERLEGEGFPATHGGLIISQLLRRAGKNAMMMRVLLELLGELKPQAGTTVNNTNIIETDAYQKGYKQGQDDLIEALPDDILRGIISGEIELRETGKERDPKILAECCGLTYSR